MTKRELLEALEVYPDDVEVGFVYSGFGTSVTVFHGLGDWGIEFNDDHKKVSLNYICVEDVLKDVRKAISNKMKGGDNNADEEA